jgi:stress-induced morphogen
MLTQKQVTFSCKEESRIDLTHSGMVDINHHALKSTTRFVGPRVLCNERIWLIAREPNCLWGYGWSILNMNEIGGVMITPDVLTEYVRRMMPDAAVTVSDRTGTMNHLKVVVISAAFAGKNLLDRHRLVYQALDGPMKDGRIHALEITAKTTDET